MKEIFLVLPFCFSIVDFMILFQFMSSFWERRFISKATNIIFVSLMSIGWIIVSFIVPFKYYTAITVAFTLLMVLLFEGRLRNRIILALSYVVIGKIIQFLGQIICELLFGNNQIIGENYFFAWITALIIKGLYLYTSCLHFGKEAVNYNAVPEDIGNLMMILSFVLGIHCLMEIEVYSEASSFYHKILGCINIIVFLLAYNLLLYIMLRIIRHLESYYLNKIDSEEIEYNEKLVKLILEKEEDIHRVKHDIKNRLLECFHFIDHNDLDGLKERVESIYSDIKLKDENQYTKNEELNSILQVKLGIAKNKKIEVRHNIMIPDKLKMQPGQLGVLFGNLLDNAIEASEYIPEEKRQIEVVARMKNNDLILLIRNNKSEDYSGLSTKKNDYVQHGFGISSVERLVNKYDGTLSVESDDTMFEVSAILYGVM